MHTVNTLAALRAALPDLRAAGQLALVPTMGALHDGHVALVRRAKELADRVVVSIFVNPTQFGPNEDLSTYPRRLEEDIALLEAEGVDLLWAPPVAEVYPNGFATKVSVSGVSEGLCGATRPGHFDGVATVVLKLFNQVQPDIAVFGEKDWQQLAVIRRMARDLDLAQPAPENIVGVATVREADGLALSSRNAYLSPEQRAKAAELPRAMRAAIQRIEAGEPVGDGLAGLEAVLLFNGFEAPRVQPLALVGAFYLLGSLAVMLPLIAIMVGGTMMSAFALGATNASTASLVTVGVIGVIVFVLAAAGGMVMSLAIWFAPALVVFDGVEALDALKLSLRAGWMNLGAFLVYGLAFMAAALVAMSPFFGSLMLVAARGNDQFGAFAAVLLVATGLFAFFCIALLMPSATIRAISVIAPEPTKPDCMLMPAPYPPGKPWQSMVASLTPWTVLATCSRFVGFVTPIPMFAPEIRMRSASPCANTRPSPPVAPIARMSPFVPFSGVPLTPFQYDAIDKFRLPLDRCRYSRSRAYTLPEIERPEPSNTPRRSPPVAMLMALAAVR